MEILQAILLGVIEGLTEFLPISSTGHLILAEEYINFKDTAKVFTVVIQLGAILAVVWYYRKDLKDKIAGLFSKSISAYNFFKNLIIATIPAGIAGFFLEKHFDTYATAGVIAAALIIGAFILLLVDNKAPKPSAKDRINLDQMTARQALGVGVAQCFALIPGVSRSGASIVGGLLGGMNRVSATAFSFYLGIPILGGAGVYKLLKDGSDLSTVSGGGLSIIAGATASFIVAVIAVTWLLKYVSTHSFRIFVYYRIILGIAVLILLI